MSVPNTLEIDSRAGDLLGRAARYKFLAAAFTYPEPSVLADLSPERWPDLEPLRGALAAFRSACERADCSSLQEEYLSLFDRQVRCSPYESSYGDGRRLGGKPVELADISGFYAAFGLEPSRSHPEMPDHIAAELEFMSALCLKEAYALFNGLVEEGDVTRSAQRSFLSDHLGRWAGAFADSVEATASMPFFRAAAALLREFVAEECRRLGAVPLAVKGMISQETADEIVCPFASDCGGSPEERPSEA